MRECKPSDVQALEVVCANLQQITTEITIINGKLSRLRKEVEQYLNQQQEPINVQTTHGLSADNG
jgi:flagellar hook-associated protein FlgK